MRIDKLAIMCICCCFVIRSTDTFANDANSALKDPLVQVGQAEAIVRETNNVPLIATELDMTYQYSYQTAYAKDSSQKVYQVFDVYRNQLSGEECKFYSNGELAVYYNYTAVSEAVKSTDIYEDIAERTDTNTDGLVKYDGSIDEYTGKLLPAIDLKEYEIANKSENELGCRIVLVKNAGTPFAEGIILHLAPDGSLCWLRNERSFISSISADKIIYFDNCYNDYVSDKLTSIGSVVEYTFTYKKVGENVVAQYITTMRGSTGAFFCDVIEFSDAQETVVI